MSRRFVVRCSTSVAWRRAQASPSIRDLGIAFRAARPTISVAEPSRTVVAGAARGAMVTVEM
jgi:hypothetical protein